MLLVGWQEGHQACKKTEWWGAGVVICLERGADLHMAQLMPLRLTVSCFSKIQIGFTFVVPAHLGSPWQRAVKRVCVCYMCLCDKAKFVNAAFCCHYPTSWGSGEVKTSRCQDTCNLQQKLTTRSRGHYVLFKPIKQTTQRTRPQDLHLQHILEYIKFYLAALAFQCWNTNEP